MNLYTINIDFWKNLQNLYTDIWNCQKLNNCKSDISKKFIKDKQYCQIPYVGIQWLDKIIPKQLFLAYNPRLGYDNYGYPSNTKEYAEKVLQWEQRGAIWKEEYNRTHYTDQMNGTNDNNNYHCYGLAENEIWAGSEIDSKYKYGIKVILKNIFKQACNNPQLIAFCNLIPCSGLKGLNKPSINMINNCREKNYIGRLIQILRPDVIWIMGSEVINKIWYWLNDLSVFKDTNDIKELDWAWVMEYNFQKSVFIYIRHPVAWVNTPIEKINDSFRTPKKVIQFYSLLFQGWETHLDNFSAFLIERIKQYEKKYTL